MKTYKVKAVLNHPGWEVTFPGSQDKIQTRSSFSDVRVAVRKRLISDGVVKPYRVEITVAYEEK